MAVNSNACYIYGLQMISLILILVYFLFQVFSFILFPNSMCKEMCQCVLCVAVNSC